MISPCLCNVYLHRLDREWTERGAGVLVRYADDVVVMCRTREEAERALVASRVILSELGLTLKDAKTRIVELREVWEGLDFLGFHHRWGARGHARLTASLLPGRWPSRQAMAHARGRIHELTDRRRLRLPVKEVMQDVNGFLRGWAGYFRYGNSASPLTRSLSTRWCAWQASLPSVTSAVAGMAGGRSITHRTAWG